MKQKRTRKKDTSCPKRTAKAKEDLAKITKKEQKPTEQQFIYIENGQRYVTPCKTCVYLIPDNVCLFPTCIRLHGWKGQRDDRERESAEGMAGES